MGRLKDMDREVIELLILRLENSAETPTNIKELASLYIIQDHLKDRDDKADE